MSHKELRGKRRDIQIILQDPYTSLNPRMTVGSIIGEPFDIHPEVLGDRTKKEAVRDLMDKVGLNPEFIDLVPAPVLRWPAAAHRRRRALAEAQDHRGGRAGFGAGRVGAGPGDEPAGPGATRWACPTSSSVTTAVVRQIAERIAVMYLGKIVETGRQDEIYRALVHPYTKALLSAAPGPILVAERARERIELEGDVPSPVNPPSVGPVRHAVLEGPGDLHHGGAAAARGPCEAVRGLPLPRGAGSGLEG